MEQMICNQTVCNEKFENLKSQIEQLSQRQEKVENKVDEAEKKVFKIDSELTIKLVQLDAKLDFHTKLVGDKVDNIAKDIKETNEKVEKKMDEVIKTTKLTGDSFKEWLIKVGMKSLELGIYGGILYGIAKGLKLF